MKKEEFIKDNYITDKEFELIAKYIMIRTKKNVSQRKLAEMTGMAQSTIARIEKNVHTASLSSFLKMVDALDYHVELVKNK